MIIVLPGTTMEVNLNYGIQPLLDSLFCAGGLMLSQLRQITGVSPHTIRNWVKRGFLSPPVSKRYTQEQFCTVALYQMLNETFQMKQIKQLFLMMAPYTSTPTSLLYTTAVEVVTLLPQEGDIHLSLLKQSISEKATKIDLPQQGIHILQQVTLVIMLAYLSGKLKEKATWCFLSLER